ncbi:DUF6907 domain-containing protein [Streptomyces abikoensis]|uniref:DUF6907 domain-containing protein n=1 Tax=Streptomyces abikoensis TaxID=97398 RepID=A0ABW7T9Y3_9ACTN
MSNVPSCPAPVAVSAATVPPESAVEPALAPSPAGPERRWSRRIWRGGQVMESCPSWCASTHSNDQDGDLDDLVHASTEVTMHLPVFDADEGVLAMPVLAAGVRVEPYSEDPARRLPHVLVEPWQDEVMEALGPEELAAVIARVRAHCDRLDGVLARLVAARVAFGVG